MISLPLSPHGGKGLAILRPGVMGLTVHRAPPFAPPPRCCHPLATTRRFGRAISALPTDYQKAAVGVRRRPGTASGASADRPLPGAPSGDPTPITPSVEELVSPTPFLDFVEMHCGLWEIGVFGP